MDELELLKSWVRVTRIIHNESLLNDKFENKITYNEVLVLTTIVVNNNNFVPFSEVLELTKMLKSQLNRTINSLEKKNYIIRRVNNEDKRCQEVKATNDGLKILSEIKETMLNVVRRFINVIGEEDSKKLSEIFTKIIDNQDKIIK